MNHQSCLVFGAGSFGTAIAHVLAHNFHQVFLFTREEKTRQAVNELGENTPYMPGKKIGPSVKAITSWDELPDKKQVELLVSGLPSSAIKPFCEENHQHLLFFLQQGVPVVSLSKGIDPQTLELSDDLFFHFFLDYRDQFVFLSGPSFADEIMEHHATTVSLAGRSTKHLKKMSEMLERDFFRVFLTYDVKGVLLGGALKNVLAIAGGIIEGLGYGNNTRAAMITRGIYEMLRFGKVFNARPETFYGLSGMGDLILTTTGTLSRNKSFGVKIAQGHSPSELLQGGEVTVEGHQTAKAVHHLAAEYEVRCPLFEGVYQVLYQGGSPQQVIRHLMERPARFEI